MSTPGHLPGCTQDPGHLPETLCRVELSPADLKALLAGIGVDTVVTPIGVLPAGGPAADTGVLFPPPSWV